MLSSKARRTGAAICLVVVALAATLASGCGGGGDAPPDRFAVAANGLCRAARQQLAKTVRLHGDALRHGDAQPIARAMFNVIGPLQARIWGLKVPHADVRTSVELHEAVFASEPPLVSLIHVPWHSQKAREDAKQLESITEEIHAVATAGGISECARLDVSLPVSP